MQCLARQLPSRPSASPRGKLPKARKVGSIGHDRRLPLSFVLSAITLDLDDTLWPFAPIGVHIERSLRDWLAIHSPRTADAFPHERMQALRDQVFALHPHLQHDLTALRRRVLERAFILSDADPALTDAAYEVCFTARHRVEFYPDSLDALQRIAAHLPIAAVTNGNADLERIGIAEHFAFQLGAREHGAAKPHASIFHRACERLGVAPARVLHVGDHPMADIKGAADAGLRSCWINRDGIRWNGPGRPPDLGFSDLGQLADWLDAHAGTGLIESPTVTHRRMDAAIRSPSPP